MGDLLNQFKQSLQSRGRTEVFGLPLTDLLDKEGGTVPKIVLWATSLIESRGPETWEGIYRLSGQATTVTSLKNSIMGGRKPRSSDSDSIHSVAAVLKVRVTKFLCNCECENFQPFYCAQILTKVIKIIIVKIFSFSSGSCRTLFALTDCMSNFLVL